MLVELLPLETFTKAYGLQLLCEGLGHLGGPPFAGKYQPNTAKRSKDERTVALLADLTKTWSYSFHLGAVWIAVAGVLVLIIPYTKNRKMFGKGPVEKELSERD